MSTLRTLAGALGFAWFMASIWAFLSVVTP